MSTPEPNHTGAPPSDDSAGPSPETMEQYAPTQDLEVSARERWGADGHPDNQSEEDTAERPVTTILTQTVARPLLPVSFMIGIAILVKGYADTGDGFSGGVVLSLGALLQYVVFGQHVIERLPIFRYAPAGAFVGLLLALSVTFVPVLLGDPILTHFPGRGEAVIHLGTVEIITAVLFDIGVCLLVFGFVVGTIGLIARTGSMTILQHGLIAQPAQTHRERSQVTMPLPSETISTPGQGEIR